MKPWILVSLLAEGQEYQVAQAAAGRRPRRPGRARGPDRLLQPRSDGAGPADRRGDRGAGGEPARGGGGGGRRLGRARAGGRRGAGGRRRLGAGERPAPLPGRAPARVPGQAGGGHRRGQRGDRRAAGAAGAGPGPRRRPPPGGGGAEHHRRRHPAPPRPGGGAARLEAPDRQDGDRQLDHRQRCQGPWTSGCASWARRRRGPSWWWPTTTRWRSARCGPSRPPGRSGAGSRPSAATASRTAGSARCARGSSPPPSITPATAGTGIEVAARFLAGQPVPDVTPAPVRPFPALEELRRR